MLTKFSNIKKLQPNKIYFTDNNYLTQYAKNWTRIWADPINAKILKSIKIILTPTEVLFKSTRPALGIVTSLFILSNIYQHLNFKSLFNVFLYLRNLRSVDSSLNIYKLHLTFTSNRLFINLLNMPGKNYISLSVGLFLKFFKNKKSFKKNKLVKLLLVKYVRKLLLLCGIKNIYLFVQKKPHFFHELCKVLTTPLVNTFFNPLTSTTVYDNPSLIQQPFYIRYFFFRQTKAFNTMRQARQGRLKRKIMRRIVRTNRIAD